MTGIHAAVARLAEVARTGWTDTLSPMTHLTCTEVEALADVLRAAGQQKLAAHVVLAHAEDDEPDERAAHFAMWVLTDETPLPYLLDERVIGLSMAEVVRDGIRYPAREVYTEDGITFQHLTADGQWVTFDQHPA